MNHQETFDLSKVIQDSSADKGIDLKYDSNKNGKFEKSIISFIINTYLGGYYGSENPSEDSRQMYLG